MYLLCAAVALVACGGGGGGGGSSNNPPSGGGPVTPTTVTVGGTVSGLAGSGLILRNNGGDELPISSDGAFVFRGTIAAGSGTYSVSVHRQPASPVQTCNVQNGTGAAGIANIANVIVECRSDYTSFIYQYEPLLGSIGTYVTNDHNGQLKRLNGLSSAYPEVSLIHPSGRVFYAIPDNEDAIHFYAVDRANGALTEFGTPMQVGGGTLWGHIHPSGKFMYVANSFQDRISAFAVRDDGTLAALPPLQLPAGSFPRTAEMASDGRFLIVGNTGPPLGDASIANISVFVINPETGALTLAPGSPAAAPVPPTILNLVEQESLLFLTPLGSSTTAAFRIDVATGALTSIPAPVRSTPVDEFVAHPRLPVVYWSLRPLVGPTRQVEVMSLNASGELLPVSDSAQDVGDELIYLWIEPSGRFLFAYTRKSVVAFTIDVQSGRLSDRRVISGPRYHVKAIRSHTPSLRRAKFVYTANDGGGNISAFAVDNTNGSLSPVSTSLPARGRTLFSAVDSRGRFLYTANTGPEVTYGYTIGSDGRPTPMTAGGAFIVPDPMHISIDLADRFLFVSSSRTQQIFAFSIDPTTGVLAFANATPTPYGAAEMAIHPDGQKLYLLNGALLSIFDIGSTGELTRQLDRTVNGYKLTLHPNGRFLYLVNYAGDAIHLYDSVMPAGISPEIVAVSTGFYEFGIDPTGRFGYAGSRDRIHAFSIEATTGKLSPVSGSPFLAGALSPYALTFDATGRTLYVANGAREGVTAFSIDERTGALTVTGPLIATPGFPNDIVAAGTQE